VRSMIPARARLQPDCGRTEIYRACESRCVGRRRYRAWPVSRANLGDGSFGIVHPTRRRVEGLSARAIQAIDACQSFRPLEGHAFALKALLFVGLATPEASEFLQDWPIGGTWWRRKPSYLPPGSTGDCWTHHHRGDSHLRPSIDRHPADGQRTGRRDTERRGKGIFVSDDSRTAEGSARARAAVVGAG
jgi:hypothetical protein